MNVVEGAVGPTLMLELSVEGLQVAAVVDTASNSLIISRSMLHEIKQHLQAQGKPMPQLELPCVPLYGKHDCVYIDDILVVSCTFKEHLQHLEQIFDRLRKINRKRVPFFVTK